MSLRHAPVQFSLRSTSEWGWLSPSGWLAVFHVASHTSSEQASSVAQSPGYELHASSLVHCITLSTKQSNQPVITWTSIVFQQLYFLYCCYWTLSFLYLHKNCYFRRKIRREDFADCVTSDQSVTLWQCIERYNLCRLKLTHGHYVLRKRLNNKVISPHNKTFNYVKNTRTWIFAVVSSL